jgi:hypothetical protein
VSRAQWLRPALVLPGLGRSHQQRPYDGKAQPRPALVEGVIGLAHGALFGALAVAGRRGSEPREGFAAEEKTGDWAPA